MSARQIKRLQALIAAHDEDDNVDNDDEPVSSMQPKKDKKSKKAQSDVPRQQKEETPLPSSKAAEPAGPKKKDVIPDAPGEEEETKSAKKEQKKEQKRRKHAENQLLEEQLLETILQEKQSEGHSAATLDAHPGSANAVGASVNAELSLEEHLESCNPQRLDTRIEKIRKLGKEAVEGNNPQRRAQSNPYMQRSGKLPIFRLCPFATADRYTWPPFAPLLSLQVDQHKVASASSDSGASLVSPTAYFVDESHPENTKAQERYERCVRSMVDVRVMVQECLHHAPYHLGTLLQLHNTFAILGDAPQSQELLERALYVCGVLLGRFPLSQTSSKRTLLYSVPANQQVFLCLSRGIHQALKVGCGDAAFGLCKLLLSLDPADPKSVLLMLDYISIRAKEWTFVSDIWPVMSRRFPGFAFNGALGKFFLEQNAEPKTDAGAESPPPPSALQMLHDAIVLHPRAAALLCEKIELTSAAAANKEPTITMLAESAPTNHGAERVNKLFAERSFDIWKSKEVQGFVRTAVQMAVQSCFRGSDEAVKKLLVERDGIARSNIHTSYAEATLEDVKGETATRIPQELLANFQQRDDDDNDQMMAAMMRQQQQQEAVQISQYDADMFHRMEAAFGYVPGTYEERNEVYRAQLAVYERAIGAEINPVALFFRTLLPGAPSILEMAIQRALADAGVEDPVRREAAERREQQWQEDQQFWRQGDAEAEMRRRDDDSTDVD